MNEQFKMVAHDCFDHSNGTQAVRVLILLGRAIAQAVSRWLPTVAARVRARVLSSGIFGGQSGAGAGFSPSTSVSPVNLHSTKYPITIITRGRYSRPFSGRRAEWTQFGLQPPPCEKKN
jgi:hypothetical protein